MIAKLLRRGLLAGLLAGLLSGAFAFTFGEPAIDRSIQLEHAAGGHSHGEEELFSRTGQKVGLFFATGLFGLTSGGVFGLAYAYFRDRLRAASEWGRSLSLAAAGFLAIFLIPFLKYPANPPAVGDPETIGSRTAAYFALMALSLAVVVGGWALARALQRRGLGEPARHALVGAGCAVVVAAAFLVLPAATEPGEFPAGLLWEFRMSSLGTQSVFWLGLGCAFGLLGERSARKAS